MYPHGIMFHYFHDNKIVKATQGSISDEKLCEIIEITKKKYNLMSAQDFLDRGINGKLREKDVCLTFDDGLSSQYQVAYPILKSYGITAFWFVYTSVHNKGTYEKLEVYRVFRNNFDNIEQFYSLFYRMLEQQKMTSAIKGWNSKEASRYKQEAAYYTENDRRFRYVRDFVLSNNQYDEVINSMMKNRRFSIEKECDGIWINSEQLVELCKEGNIVGLHSHTHPTVMSKLSYEGQMKEYSICQKKLEEMLPNNRIISASYPCDYYNEDTLDIMKELGIKLGFVAHMERSDNPLLIARQDSANF